jgi:DUF177 domain-containing protein
MAGRADMLALDVARLREGAESLDRTIQPSALPAEDDYRITAPVVLEAKAVKDKAKVRIVGHATTTLELTCSRCLEGYPLPVDAEFDLMFLPAADAPGPDSETELAEEDINTAFYRDGVIDLGELLHEQFYLTLPMKPLCREDCKGLCPVCGANWNVTTCSCEHRWEDPRLAGLKALLKDNDDA